MARVRTVDFLPEIFQTSTNKQFLSATLDQLVQEPQFKTIQGFVGRRFGPGVNSNDQYVAEVDPVRAQYQLEPGVIFKNSENSQIKDAITYPGLNAAVGLQGGFTNNADRLYKSDYYTWDPFVDLDKFVNFSQYYWLPAGPDAVNVYAETVPLTQNFVVTRANGVYTFSNVKGDNPEITLVRGGSYTFQVAQNDKETVNYRVSNDNIDSWTVDYQSNPTLTLTRGNTYVFNLVGKDGLSFYIKTEPSLTQNNAYNEGVTNNGAATGLITFTVPQDAPDTLYYVNPLYRNMQGTLNIVDPTDIKGPGFWIQTDPGVNGKLPYAPNISSRDVLGVINNGEVLGTVTFNVPTADAQNFYYTLENIGSVDLVSNLKFNQINNVFLDTFLETYGNIDGISSLNGKTLIFSPDVAGGWERTSQYDPLPSTAAQGLPGTYDSLPFDYTTDINTTQQGGIWQIQYQYTESGDPYLTLQYVKNIDENQSVSITNGTVYSNTSWYKDALGSLEQIPLLTAVKNVLYYQDGTDPEIFGRIKIIEQESSDSLDVNSIIGKKTYTSPNGVTFTNGLKVQFIGSIVPASYEGNSYYVEGVGTAIKLLPVTNFVTPETYTQSATVPYDSTKFDVGNYDASLNQPAEQDYLTINRASQDLNAWTRSNRWFHIDVINATANYNNTIAVLDNNFRGKRPIIEFRAGTRLFKFGTEGKQPVDIIDFNSTDALSQINGSTGYSTDGYTFTQGSRVIFAADSDPQVRNKIYTVEFIEPDSIPPLIAEPIINLVPASDSTVLVDQTVVCLSGVIQQGRSYYYDGVVWTQAQEKTGVNQAPLFDVYDLNGVSFGDRLKYPSTNFVGSKLFSYATGTGVIDPVLNLKLKYLSLNNVGDIVFDNNLYTDQFIYTKDSVSSTEYISQGTVRQYTNRTIYVRELGWQNAVEQSVCRQQFQFIYNNQPLRLDIAVDNSMVIPALQIFVGSTFQDPSTYTFETTENTTTITLNNKIAIGENIQVLALSNQISRVAFYEVPSNLENNPLNNNSPSFTLGTVRTHYDSITQNLRTFVGKPNGANNVRDLGNVLPYGQIILQQSSPATLAGYFMRSKDYNIFAALNYNAREYEKYKALLLDMVIRNDYTNYTIPDMLTAAITDLSMNRTSSNSFYWSDMLPGSSVYNQITVTVTPITSNTFDLTTIYDFTSSNYKGLLVYLNDELLTINYDYTVAVDGPRLTITKNLNVGDIVVIREYATTYGSFVPNTPTKMGLYPAFKPEIYLDTTYINPVPVIRGHDGSITVAFGDFRDQLLLEFELRIFNNLKIKSKIPLTTVDIIPGQFRTTQYSLGEVNEILSTEFLSWIGWNKLNYKLQDYNEDNAFTWNYSKSGNLLSSPGLTIAESAVPCGAWRGLYRYFYDTQNVATMPWEMLGFSQRPSWWNEVYGEAPYTKDNLVLWDDLAQGKVADPAGEYYKPQYARPRLSEIIPTDDEGQLLPPFNTVIGVYDPSSFEANWIFGDGGPVESAWFTSSSYPFAIMRLFALTRPAEFFSLFADRDLYKYSEEFGQYLYNDRYRLDANGVEVYGNGTSKASYINWIVDYNQLSGRNSATALETDLANLDVRLCYRMGAFTDKQYTKIYTEKSSPNSLNSSLLLPDESYSLLVYKNQAFERIIYSSLIFQVVDGGYAVYGYSITNPYFNVLVSKVSGTKTTITSGGASVTVPDTYTNDVTQVPYGYTFTNKTLVVDFILSYGALLEKQGLTFDGMENGRILNWYQMAQEFLYWAGQGWQTGSVVNLNPAAQKIQATREQAIIDSVVVQTPENLLLDQNRLSVPISDLVVDRMENTFILTSLTNQTISYADLRYTNFESMIVLDNVSIFNDLIYNPTTGARQGRVNIQSYVSADWNGQLDYQGFILNDPTLIKPWMQNKKYTKGDIVIYKNNYWSAQDIVQPSVNFDYSKWVKSDYTKIQRGFLPNLPNKSNQLANSYNIYSSNLETDQDLLSYGLIGFRPREYMAALNLDDVSQVNLYAQMLGTKGTERSVRIMGEANFNKEIAEYNIYENWAIQKGAYGANANKSFIELRLNEALLRSDPALVQIVNVGEQSLADQAILLQDVWRESYKLTSTDILPTTYASPTDVGLPSAGYADLDDVDITVFSLLGQLGLAPGVISTVGVGTTIWAAKINDYDWGIYRCVYVPAQLIESINNLNGTGTLVFNGGHGLSLNDVIIVKNFNENVNGAYRVIAVPSPSTVIVAITSTNRSALTTVIQPASGEVYRLDTMRVAQASDAVNLPYTRDLVPGAKIYVDNNGAGLWAVYEKTQPFTSTSVLKPTTSIPHALYGTSIAQSPNNIMSLIGAPGYHPLYTGTTVAGLPTVSVNTKEGLVVGQSVIALSGIGSFATNAVISSISAGSNDITLDIACPTSGEVSFYVTPGQGAVYAYLKDTTNNYALAVPLTLTTTNTLGYGNEVVIGNQNWAAAGASLSNNGQGYVTVIYRASDNNAFEQRQLLVAPDEDYAGNPRFGEALAISRDERWLYIGAPGVNKVYAYGRYDLEEQFVRYKTDGTTRIFAYSQNITIDNDEQLSVVLNNKLLTYNVDYTVNSQNVVLVDIPASGLNLIISRLSGKTLGLYYNVIQTSTSGAGTGASFTVSTVNQTSGVYEVSITEGGSGYAVSDTLTIDGTVFGSWGDSVSNDLVLTVTSVSSGAITGVSVAGTPSHVLEVNRYLYTATDYDSFTVTVNGVLQRARQDYEIVVDGDAIGIEFTYYLESGDSVAASSKTYFKFVDILEPTVSTNANFGAAITTTTDGRQVIVGAPANDITGYSAAGSTFVFNKYTKQIIVSNPATVTYSIPTLTVEPVAVSLNGTFLTNADQYINGDFTVDLVTHTITFTNNVTLAVGDIIDIDTNLFSEVQEVSADVPFQSGKYGSSLDMCSDDDELYIGSPYDGLVIFEGGSVEMRSNQARNYGTITATVANPTLTAGQTLQVNYQEVAVPSSPNNTVAGLANAINNSGIPNVTASVTNGYLTISVENKLATQEGGYLNVWPGLVGSVYADLGFECFAFTQTIRPPVNQVSAHFGSKVWIDTDYLNLVVSAPGGTTIMPESFDGGKTYFDDHSTNFSTNIIQSGAVYTYDYLESANDSVTNPGQFIFGQQIYSNDMQSLDLWGTGINYVTGVLLVGSPGSDIDSDDSFESGYNFGRVGVFKNPNRLPAWKEVRVQQPAVDVALLDSVYMYNKLLSAKGYFFDYINPLQGKILGAARRNIDYVSGVDPAKYNTGTLNNNGNYWADGKVGQIWWDTSTARFIDPDQNDIVYAAKRWGQLFPHSTVDVYQWIESTVPPSDYGGSGQVRSTTSYTVRTKINGQGVFETFYYYWVTGLVTINTTAGKTLSTTAIARYIESPQSSGIPYIAGINANTIAIYNGLEFLSAADTIIHIDFSRIASENSIHTEFELIARDKPDSFLTDNLYLKLQDSFCGVNSTGAKVPDTTLSPPERYGVQFRPRQSMFVDRFMALENYLTRVNRVLKDFPIIETRKFNLLNSAEPEPTAASGEWNKRLENIEQLGYQDLNAVPVGYKYLIMSDSTNGGLWTIYTVLATSNLIKYTLLTRVQTYDTRKYWHTINWYLPGYNQSIVPVREVPVYASLNTISVPVGSSVKVTGNAQGKWEIYLKTDIGWDRVGLQDGTIEFDESLWNYSVGRFGFDVEVFDAQYFDQDPAIETRKIIQAINQELLIDDLAIERNRALILMFEYILTEQESPEWITKTSLIDVEHRIRQLIPYQIYRRDNQEFLLDYIKEVKPYHVVIKEFNLSYSGFDDYTGSVTDFDLPAYYNTELETPQYTSPILTPYTASTAVGTGTQNYNSDVAPNSELWTLQPWNFWFDNYLLEIQDVEIVDSGLGYTVAPTVTVTGTCITPAVMQAVTNSAGQVVAINILDPGSGYSSTAIITITGGNGDGARAVAVMGNNLVRNIKTTIKYDRYQYTSDVSQWTANVVYANGDQVRYLDTVWQANNPSGPTVTGATFNPDYWTKIPADDLSGIDRTQGYYAPTVNEPGVDLPLVISGLDYPGVQVFGPNFNQNSGFDVGNYDINPYDNLSYGPEGKPTYDPGILDAIYNSQYLDPYLGILPAPAYDGDPPNLPDAVVVRGGEYVDTYSSHAPEELVPGATFDTLDFRVYTRPGADWDLNGHGFASQVIAGVYNTGANTISFAGLLPDTALVLVANQTVKVDMTLDIDYTVDYVNQVVTIVGGASNGDVIVVTAYEVGGGNQLLQQLYNGADVGNQLIVDVQTSEIQEIDIWVNGLRETGFTYSASGSTTVINFTSTYTATDELAVYVLGPTTIDSTTVNYSWSAPDVEYLIGTVGVTTYPLTNSLEYTNPINLIVTVDGVRARTAACAEYIADGSTGYLIPDRIGVSQSLISDNQVFVYVDEVVQTLGVDYFVEPYTTGDVREVLFAIAPNIGSRIVVAVTTGAQCYVTGSDLVFNTSGGLLPSTGSVIAVTTWNDTRQQNLITKVFVGPIEEGVVVTEGYDSVNYDDTPFAYTVGTTVSLNDLQLGRVITDPSRMWVALNGQRLFYGVDFTIVGEELILVNGVLNLTDVVIVTMMTESVVPNKMAFRIFQDMRGVQTVYRITDSTTTVLTDSITEFDDIIYVENASALPTPDLAVNLWGVITIGGERIMYREIDTVNNTLSGLLRGTWGTGLAPHTGGDLVYNMGRVNLLPLEDQNYIDSNTFMGDGSTVQFDATNINLSSEDSTIIDEAVEVYVGGTRITSGYSLAGDNPVTVVFDTAPDNGVEILILVRRGVTWYAPGPGTPSDGQALQDTDTNAARFLRGLI